MRILLFFFKLHHSNVMLDYFNTAATWSGNFNWLTGKCFGKCFCISSRICSFNSGLLLKTSLLRYPQRKKSIGDKSGLRVGQLMSPLLDMQKFCILNAMSRRCNMLPHVRFCMVINVNLCVECGLKMFWARLRC